MGDFDKIKLLHKSYRLSDFKPKNLFSTNSSKQDNLILLSFYITTMSLEILMNQPFKKKIKIRSAMAKSLGPRSEFMRNNLQIACILIKIIQLHVLVPFGHNWRDIPGHPRLARTRGACRKLSQIAYAYAY